MQSGASSRSGVNFACHRLCGICGRTSGLLGARLTSALEGHTRFMDRPQAAEMPSILLNLRNLAPQPPGWHTLRAACPSWRSAVYKPRNPRASPLFRLLESLYETVKGVSGGSLRVALRLLARSLWTMSSRATSIAATGTQASLASGVGSVPRTMPILRSQAWRRGGRVSCRRGRRGRWARPVGVHGAEDAEVLLLPPA